MTKNSGGCSKTCHYREILFYRTRAYIGRHEIIGCVPRRKNNNRGTKVC